MTSRFFTVRQFTGYHMAAVMAVFFGTIIGVNIVMAFFAVHSWTGLVVDNAYVESQHFDEHTALRAEALKRGWRSALSYEKGTLILDLSDRDGRPVSGVEATLAIGRPSHEGEDRTLTLIESASGRYSARTALEPGVWAGDITAHGREATPWIRAVRLYVRER